MVLTAVMKILGEVPVLAEDAAKAVAEFKSDPNASAKSKTVASGLALMLAELTKAL